MQLSNQVAKCKIVMTYFINIFQGVLIIKKEELFLLWVYAVFRQGTRTSPVSGGRGRGGISQS